MTKHRDVNKCRRKETCKMDALIRQANKWVRLLLSLNAHNHADDYSGTLGGVCKVHISALVTSPKNLVVALSFRHSLSVSQQKNKNKNELLQYLTGQWEARDTKVSKAVASTASMESEFQSLMVRGKKDLPRYCILVVMRLSCWLWVRRWREGWGGGGVAGTSLVLMMGHWTSPLHILYITPRRKVFLRCCKDGHLSESSMRFTLEVLWYQFSMNWAARLWTASNLSMLFWVHGSHTDEAYIFKYGSDKGLVRLYALSFMALELIFWLCRRKPSVLLALFATLLMWLSQSISCCIVMPRYLADPSASLASH